MTVKRLLAVVFVLVTAMSVASRAPAAPSIQPGDYMSSGDAACTLGFVVDGTRDDGDAVYMLTAAHCVSKVGSDVALYDGTVFGDAAAIGNPERPSQDWALISVRPDFAPRVKAAVRGHAKMPTGVAKSSNPGDEVLFSGYGLPFDQTAETREGRFGYMVSQSKSRYALIGMDSFGDSGGPIVLADNGRAMGLVSALCIGLCTSEGPTVAGILQQAAAKGFPVTLRTA